ncbi:hypothetical protein DLAC_10416 [Tieghemostelium lacteum]|uniref:Uncharacterized protein n=1 Tax=Tieghemostelium lacteum TaxID=361077 RepID=A0A151Z5C6_TIELA|nr:hypothetical protein DLAC_10416 [Tieghemostelium lacteum]|eukprot:KYQ89170.1 hypothetical protein DLAC_10416 [Tieghemostelium lacteum]
MSHTNNTNETTIECNIDSQNVNKQIQPMDVENPNRSTFMNRAIDNTIFVSYKIYKGIEYIGDLIVDFLGLADSHYQFHVDEYNLREAEKKRKQEKKDKIISNMESQSSSSTNNNNNNTTQEEQSSSI